MISHSLRRSCASLVPKRGIATIINTHKHLTRRLVVQQHGNPRPSTLSFSNSSPIQSQAQAVAANNSPGGGSGASTLGFAAPDNTTITNPVKSDAGEVLKVKISQRAAQKLNDINKQDQKPDQVLRIAVESGGCHGYQYILGLKDRSTIDATEDSVFERDGAAFVVDATSLEILRDSTVDYTTELIGSQFKVVNSPYATSSCGCGSSFDFDPTGLPK